MKVVISVCTFAAVAALAAGAPALTDVFVPEPVYYGPDPYLRAKRSSYGPAYGSPCAAAPIAIAPAGGYYSPLSHGGGYGGGAAAGGYGASAHGYGAPSFGYGAPHYRADEAETEILNFSDMEQGMTEHMPMARYGYGAPIASHASGVAGIGYGGQLAPAAAAGPAFGVFPNANVGGCNVPLLLSCSPSIVPGRLVKGGYGSAGYGAAGAGYGSGAAAIVAAPNAYRGADEHTHLEHEEHAEEMTAHSMEHTEDTHTDSHQ